jgi:hypothetical protein
VDFFSPVKVVVPGENTAVDVFAGNVSKTGMFLRSNRPLPKGKKITLEFETNAGKVKVEEGEVVWNKAFEPISIDGAPAGMGIEFKSMPEDSKLKIEAFIDDALQTQPQPAKVPAAASAGTKPDLAPAAASAGTKPDLAPAAKPLRMNLDVAASEPRREQAEQPKGPVKPAEEKPPIKEGVTIMLTTPPRRRTKMMLFGGFVLLVALVTFLTLILLKPPGNLGEPEAAKPATAENPVPSEEPNKLAAKSAVPPSDEPVAKKKPEPIAEKKPEPSPAGTSEDLQVGPAVFSEKSGEWRMVVAASGPVEIKHFTLKNPPRLAVDFKGATYSGKTRTNEHLAPSVARVRVGEQPKFTRFVLDFNGSKVPRHRIVRKKDRVVVIFER